MQAKNLLLGAMCAAFFGMVACTALEPYKINAPEDLAEKIAEYKAEKEAQKTDDYEEIDISVAVVGAEDNSSAWWSEFSQYFTVPSGKKLVVEFLNFGSGANNWNNWNVCVSNGERDGDGYSEYFVLRSDAYGWGNADYNGAIIEFDYGGGEVNWDEFREKMQGAHVTLSVDHAKAGAAYVEAHSVSTDGFEIVEKYNQAVSATNDINVFLISDGSHFEMQKAYLVPSEIAEIPDFPLVDLQLTNTPVAVALGEEDYWGSTVATAVFEDGFTAVIPKEELFITEPDMTTTGTKTVVVSYAKTKLGEPGDPIAAYYNFEVTDFASIAVTKLPVSTSYFVYDSAVPFFTQGLEVTGTKSDGSTMVLDNAALVFGVVEAIPGSQDVDIEFSGVKTTCPVTVKLGTEAFGATDFTNGWWTTFMSEDKPVAAGESVTIHTFLYSDNLENWHSPCTILRGAALNEYAVVRMDNFGWGAGYDGNPNLVTECDWNFDTFAANQNMSAVSITVTNNGDGTATIVYNVTYANGETHVQKYSGIAVDSADLQVGLVSEESYVVILDAPAVAAKLVGIDAVANANVVGGAKYITLSPEAVKVSALYSDGSSVVLGSKEVAISFANDKVVYDAIPGTVENVATVKYTPVGGSELTASANLVIKASAQETQTEIVGATDNSTAFWGAHSRTWSVAPGESETVSFTVGGTAAEANWNCPVFVVKTADAATEFLVARLDNFGWGNSYDGVALFCDWNWDTYLSNMPGSKICATVANDGCGNASLRIYDIDAAGVAYHQYFDNIAVNSADTNFSVTLEKCHLIFD